MAPKTDIQTYMVLPLIATTCLLATGYRFKTSSYTCNKIDLPKVHLSLHGFHWFHGLHHLHALHLLHGLHRFHFLQGLHVLHCLLFFLAFVTFIGLRWSVAFWDLVNCCVTWTSPGSPYSTCISFWWFLETKGFCKIVEPTLQTSVGGLGSFGSPMMSKRRFNLTFSLIGSNGKSCGFTTPGGSSTTLGLRRGRM